jgi:hypothetical protein
MHSSIFLMGYHRFVFFYFMILFTIKLTSMRWVVGPTEYVSIFLLEVTRFASIAEDQKILKRVVCSVFICYLCDTISEKSFINCL